MTTKMVVRENRNSGSKKSRRLQRALTFAVAAGSVSTCERLAYAANITLTANDTGATQNSFLYAPNWSNSAAPSGNNTYEVTGTNGASLLRAYDTGNNTTGNATFAGASLQLDDGAELYVKTTGTITVGNLILAGGFVDVGGVSSNNASTLAGNITLNTGSFAASYLDSRGASVFTVSSNISGSGNLTINGNDTLDGQSGNAIVTYTGTVMLTGNNSAANNGFNGLTTISAGTLNLDNTNAIGNSTLVFSAGTLVFNSAVGGNFTFGGLSGTKNIGLNDGTHAVALTVGTNNGNTSYTGALSGNGSLTKTGSGNLTLANNDTYTGNTTINNGGLQLGAANAVGNSTVVVSSGGSLYFSPSITNFTIGGLSGSGNVTLADISNAAINLSTGNGNGNNVYSGNLSGGGSLTKIGTGQLTLSGTSSYSGATAINGGGILVSGSLGSTAVTVGNGAAAAYLTATGNGIATGFIAGNVTVSANAAIDFSKDGATTTAQTLNVGSLSLATGNSTANSASLTYNIGSQGSDTISTTGNLSLVGSGQAVINLGGTLTNGNYTLLTYANQTGISAFGNFTSGNASAPFILGTKFPGLISYTFDDTSNALTLQISAAANPAVAYWSGAFNSTAGGNSTWSGFNGTGPVTNWSDSTGTADAGQTPGPNSDVVFTATNSGNGSNGTSGASLSGTAVSTTLDVSYTINSLTVNSTPGSVTIGGTGTNLTINAAAGTLYSAGTGINILSGAGPVTINTTGEVIAAASQTWTNASSSLFSVSSGIEGTATSGNTTTLTLSGSGSGNTTLSGTIADSSSTGQLALLVNGNGTGVVNLSAANTFSGGATLSAGTLDLANANAAQNSVVTLSGGSLVFSAGIGNFTVGGLGGSGNVTLADTASNTVNLVVGNNNNSANYSGILGGSGNLTKVGSGTQTLSAANTFTGLASISGGTLQLGNAVALQNNTVVASGGTLTFSTGIGNFTIGGVSGSTNITLADTSTNPVTLITGNGNGNNTYSGVLSGGGALTHIGSGTLTLSNVSSYSGGTTISAGTLTVTSTGTNPLGTGTVTIGSAGTFNFTGTGVGTADFANAFAGSGNITTTGTFNPSGNWSAFSGTVTTSGGLGRITTFAANSTSGNASYVLNGATGNDLALGNGVTSAYTANLGALSTGPSGNGSTTVRPSGAFTGGTVTVAIGNLNTNTTFAGVFTNNGDTLALTKVGTGSLTLTGPSSYSAGTIISAGTLFANNATSSLGNGTVTVLSGATLSGNGSTGTGAVTVNAGGILTAGRNTTMAGILQTDLTVNGNATITSRVFGVSGSPNPTPGTDFDQVADSAGVTTLGASTSSPINVQLTLPNGNATAGFSPTSSYTFPVLTFHSVSLPNAGAGTPGNGTITVLATDNGLGAPTVNSNYAGLFTLDTTAFASSSLGTASNGSFALDLVIQSGGNGDLEVDYAGTPEPGTTILVLGGAVPMLMGRRRRRAGRRSL